MLEKLIKNQYKTLRILNYITSNLVIINKLKQNYIIQKFYFKRM
jgi:hypothetical protein